MSDKCACRPIMGFQGKAEGMRSEGCAIHGLTFREMEERMKSKTDKAAMSVVMDRDVLKHGPTELALAITEAYRPLVEAIKARALYVFGDEPCWCRSVLSDLHDPECMALRKAWRDCVGSEAEG